MRQEFVCDVARVMCVHLDWQRATASIARRHVITRVAGHVMSGCKVSRWKTLAAAALRARRNQ
jgi:hypothetical protein